MKKAPAILSFLMLVSTCLPVSVHGYAVDPTAWLPKASQRLEAAGWTQEAVNEFRSEMEKKYYLFSDASEAEMNEWLEAVITTLSASDGSEPSQEELSSLFSEADLGSLFSGDDWADSWNEKELSEAALQEFPDLSSAESFGEDNLDDFLNRFGENLSAYCDTNAIFYALTEAEDPTAYLEHIAWLADQVIHVIEPQAVEKLLQIPAFESAAEDGLLGKYLGLCITSDPATGYGAMVLGGPLRADGSSVQEADEPVYNIGYVMNVNLSENGPELQADDAKLRELEDTILHELTHAFMNDLNRNGMIGTDRYGIRHFPKNEDGSFAKDLNGEEINENAFPAWFAEGTATSVQAGYTYRRNELLEFFGGGEDREALADTLANRDQMIYALSYGMPGPNAATLLDMGNAYNVGYVACMFLYSMAAEKLGLDPYQGTREDRFFNENALMHGMSSILDSLRYGKSLDQIIGEISIDPETGVPVYRDTEDFEEKFAQDAEDPGLVFWQMMMMDYEAWAEDPSAFIPAGSVLPDYENGLEHYLDPEEREAPTCYAIIPNPSPDQERINFPVSTVQPSRLALGGGRSYSYDPVSDALSPEEQAQRDRFYVGDQAVFVTIE